MVAHHGGAPGSAGRRPGGEMGQYPRDAAHTPGIEVTTQQQVPPGGVVVDVVHTQATGCGDDPVAHGKRPTQVVGSQKHLGRPPWSKTRVGEVAVDHNVVVPADDVEHGVVVGGGGDLKRPVGFEGVTGGNHRQHRGRPASGHGRSYAAARPAGSVTVTLLPELD